VADADTTVYAKAVRDHFNMMDSTALSFKAGETIIVRDAINIFLFMAFCCLVAYSLSHSCIPQFVKPEVIV